MSRLPELRRRSRAAASELQPLRERVMTIFEEAIDQVEELLEERPSAADARDAARRAAGDAKGAARRAEGAARETADRVRTSRTVEAAGAAIAAGAPIAARFARQQMNRRNARRAARFMPVVARAHPVLFGAAVMGGALLGMELLHRRRAPKDELSTRRLTRRSRRQGHVATGFDLDEEIARMEGEGGDAGAAPGAPGAARGRVRGGANGSRTGTR